jgi:uncharacterized membrane protein YebE (DUF533 family)
VDKHEEAMLKSLVAIAWADGHFVDEEAEILEAMLSTFDIDAEGAAIMREYAKTPRTLDDVPVAELTLPERALLLRHGVILSHIDGGQDGDERAVLDALVKKLEIPDAEATELIAAAEAEARELLDL